MVFWAKKTYFLEFVHTDLHRPLCNNWTRPANIEGPSTRRISGNGFGCFCGSSVLVNVIPLPNSP